MDEDWKILASLLPEGWRELAWESGALRRRRGFVSEDALMRVFLLHAGQGLSLRETVAEASLAGLASISDVALMKRFRAAGPWLQRLCASLVETDLHERPVLGPEGIQMRFADATHVRETGKTGSVWRIHYALDFPGLECRHASLTPGKGTGTVESFEYFPVEAGVCLIGDRGYSKCRGIVSAVERGGDVLVRCNPFQLALRDPAGQRLDLDRILDEWPKEQLIASLDCQVERSRQHPAGPAVHGRLIIVKRSKSSAEQAVARAKRKSINNQTVLQDRTLQYAHWLMLFTTLPKDKADDHACCAWYRLRWQIELAFKRLKSLAQLGHLPKRDPASIKAWLYAKLLAALLTEQLIQMSNALSPWGYNIERTTA
jgi:hypothetical protein